jgi:hypothetical protein
MEAYRIDRFGSVDGIVLRSSENPRPGLREILMRVRASSLNYSTGNGSASRVNLSGRGMLVVSVARQLGWGTPLLAYYAARSSRAGPEEGAPGPLS